MKPEIVFVTGAFVTNGCWDEWRGYFESKGYKTTAPPWPYKEGTAKELRNRQPHDTDLAALSLDKLVDHYSNIVKGFSSKPVVIGHSLGGLVSQILVNRDLVTAGAVIHSVPPQGIIPYEFSFLKAGWKSLGLFTSLKKTYLMSFRDWQYAFVNGMPESVQREAYEKYVIPESKTVARGGLSSAAKVNFNKPHVPLLIVAGSKDNIIPAHLNRRNFMRYKKSESVLDYKEFPGRNHWVLAQPGWQEVADYILTWIENVLKNEIILDSNGTHKYKTHTIKNFI